MPTTMHRADPPIDRTAKFRFRRRFDDLLCCHRSSTQPGRHLFLHEYELVFEVEFACADTELDINSLEQEISSTLRRQFGHTTLIAADDPQRELFELLANHGGIDLRIMQSTGMEASAAWTFDTTERIARQATCGRVWVTSVQAGETRHNMVTLTAD